MKTVYVTGDRSVEPLTAVNAAAGLVSLIVQEQGPDVTLVTGDAPSGIEHALRFLFSQSDRLTTYNRNVTGDKPDLDEFNERIKGAVDEVYILHPAPLDSSITKSVMRTFDPEKVHMPLTDDIPLYTGQ